MKKVIITIASILLLLIVLLGFIDIVPETPSENEEVFTYSISTIPQNLKDVSNVDKREQDIVCATSKGLVEFDKDGNLKPSLSDGVEVSSDGIQYTFKIMDNNYWSNGEKITAEDIKVFFKELITVGKEDEIEGLLNVYGARDYRNNSSDFDKQVGMSVNDNTLIIRLNSKEDNFVKELSKPQYRLRKDLSKWEDVNSNYDKIVYSGNYRISGIQEKEILLTKSEKANTELVKNIKIVEDEGEEIAMAAFEVGNRDLVINPPKSQLNRLKSENMLVTLPTDNSLYLAFNPNNTNIPVAGRREIYNDINKALGNYQTENNLLLELADGSYFREDKENIDKIQARKVMANIEEPWEKPEELVLIAENTARNKDICEYLFTWFKENRDIFLDYTLKPRDEIEKLYDDKYYNFTLLGYDNNAINREQFYNSVVNYIPNDISNNIKNANTLEEKQSLFTQIEDSIYSNYQVLPLVFYNYNIAITNKTKNVVLDWNGNINFNNMIAN